MNDAGQMRKLRPLSPEEQRQAAEKAAYWKERDMALDHDHCFLCGIELTDENRTDEHVFPKWLQRDFDLWNQELNLLNRTTIRYRALTIPCCAECNGFWLSQIEDKVSVAFRAGKEAVEALEPGLIALWMGKIYYGILFKEAGLLADRRDPNSGSILERGELEELAELHRILQAMRQRVRFDRPCGSVMVFKAQVPEQVELQFDYRDMRYIPFLAIRAGEVVVMASILDWGAMTGAITHPIFEAAEQLELHPIQFAEVAACGAYTAGRFDRKFGYWEERNGDHDFLRPVILLEPGQSPDDPVFKRFEPGEYARVLAQFTHQPYEAIWEPKHQRLWTNLRHDDESLMQVSLEQIPADVIVVPPNLAEPLPGT